MAITAEINASEFNPMTLIGNEQGNVIREVIVDITGNSVIV
jgi:hypothetical protein